MALNLTYPLKKGTYKRFRGFASHVKWNPGTWYGIDDSCVTGTPIIASEAGTISHAVRQSTGSGWNFRLNFSKYPGWFMWYAHCSSIPHTGRVVGKGQSIGKTGATGDVSGPHLHYSLMHGFVPKNPDNQNVVKWKKVDMYTEKPKKYSDGKPRSAKRWFDAFVTEFKRKKSNQSKVSILTKNVKLLSNRIVGLQTDLKDSDKEVSRQFNHIEKIEARIEVLEGKLESCQVLEGKLESCQDPSEEPVDSKKDPVRTFIINIYKWLETHFTGK